MKPAIRYRYADDRQFVADLLAGNERAVAFLLYGDFNPLLRHNAFKATAAYTAFPDEGAVTTDDLIHDFYLYFSANGWARLRRYDSALPFSAWLSVVSYRYFKDRILALADTRRVRLDDDMPEMQHAVPEQSDSIMMDVRNAIGHIASERDRNVLTALLLRDEEPQAVADRLGVSVDNLYNIKRRALARLVADHLQGYQV